MGQRAYDDGRPLQLWRGEHDEEPGEGLSLQTSVCANSECGCELCHLRGHRLERTAGDRVTRGDEVVFRASLDLATGELSSRGGGPIDPAYAWTAEALTDDHLAWLRERYRRVKGQSDAGLLDARLAGDVEEYAGGWLTPYLEVYPDDWDMRVVLDGVC